jgi:uncharacterized membrane protein YdfJ with MMPL/SSD domain
VLATSFGSLMIYDDHATKQTGFGMAIGILFASSWSAPCSSPLTAMVGQRASWPSEIARVPDPTRLEPPRALRPLADHK